MKLDVAECRDALKKTFSNHVGDLLKAILNEQDPDGGDEDQDPDGNGNNGQLPWCICGWCRRMPQEIENRCCRKRPCITTEDFFQSAVLDMSVLSIAIVNRSDVQYLLTTQNTPLQVTARQHTANGFCGSTVILAGPTDGWYHPVLCGQSEPNTQHQTTVTLVSRNTELEIHVTNSLVMNNT